MDKKILSVIIPSYNMEAYLPKCLGSLVINDNELLKKLEVIVVNDGSKDRTSIIAHEFEAMYPGVFCVIDKENGHYGSCINAALPLAKGVFVKVLDADDWFDTEMLEVYLTQVSASEERCEKVDLVLNDFDIVDSSNAVKEPWRYPLPEGVPFDLCELVSIKEEIVMHAIAYRTENIRRIHYKQTEGCLYTDNEWVFKGMNTVKNVLFVRKPLYKYLVGRDGQSADLAVQKKFAHQHIEVLDRLLDEYLRIKDCAMKAGRLFMEKYLTRLYRISLRMFLRWPFDKKNHVFYEADRKFGECFPALRKELGGSYAIFKRLKHPYYYVLRWQDRRLFRELPLCIFSSYSFVLRVSRRLKHLF